MVSVKQFAYKANYSTQNITPKTCYIELELGVDFKSTKLHPEAGEDHALW